MADNASQTKAGRENPKTKKALVEIFRRNQAEEDFLARLVRVGFFLPFCARAVFRRLFFGADFFREPDFLATVFEEAAFFTGNCAVADFLRGEEALFFFPNAGPGFAANFFRRAASALRQCSLAIPSGRPSFSHSR